MIKQGLIGLAIVIAIIGCSTSKPAVETSTLELKNKMDSVSYTLGISMAENLQKQGAEDLNKKVLNDAINTTLDGKEPIIDAGDRNRLMKEYFSDIQKSKEELAKKEQNIFLAANKKKQGVKETESGLQYKILKKGEGVIKPTKSNKVTVHYTGRLLDGKVFDSSVERGQPATFGVTQVIKGWTEALQLMTVGDKFELYIPSDLGYGARGAGRDIKPHTMLIFEVELLEIN